MTVNFFTGDEPPVDLLAATEDMFREAAEDLVRARQKLRTGSVDEIRAATRAVQDLKAAIELVMHERTRLEKLRKQVAGVVDGRCEALNFDTARSEIGRRLARLRDAAGGG